MSLQKRFNLQFSLYFYGILAWVPFGLLSPLILSVFITLGLYRALVIVLARVLPDKGLVRPLTGLDISFSTDDVFGKKPHGALAFIHVVNGKLSPDIIATRLKKFLEENKSNNGYEKLTSVFPIFWMGYPFWKRSHKKFDVKHHIKVMELRNTVKFTRFDQMDQLICEWMQEPFTSGIPLWEIRIVQEIRSFSKVEMGSSNTLVYPEMENKRNTPLFKLNNEENTYQRECENEIKSIFIFKTHHVIGDGNSMLHLLKNIFDDDNGSKPMRSFNGMLSSNKIYDVPISKPDLRMGFKYEQKSLKNGPFHHLEPTGQQKNVVVKTDESEEKVESTTEITSGRKKVLDLSEFTIFTGFFKTNLIKVLNCIGLAYLLKWMKSVVKNGFLFQLSESILLLFFTPFSLFILLKDFAIHRDCWFTQKKKSDRLILTSVCFPMEWVSEMRKNLHTFSDQYPNRKSLDCKLPLPTIESYYNFYGNISSRYKKNDSSTQEKAIEKQYGKSFFSSQVPLVVIAVSALAGALRKLLVEIRKGRRKGNVKTFVKPYNGVGTMEKAKSNERKFTTNTVANSVKEASQNGKGTPDEWMIPTYSNFVVALPLPGTHPGKTKFCNFWTHGILNVEMNELNSFRRLRSLNDLYWKRKSQRMPEIYHYLVKFHSVLPECILRLISGYNMGASIGVTNLAGPPHSVYIGGKKIERMLAYSGLQWKHASMTLALFSYNGEMNVTALANQSVIPTQQQVEKLLREYFMNELNELHPESRSSLCEPSFGYN